MDPIDRELGCRRDKLERSRCEERGSDCRLDVCDSCDDCNRALCQGCAEYSEYDGEDEVRCPACYWRNRERMDDLGYAREEGIRKGVVL